MPISSCSCPLGASGPSGHARAGGLAPSRAPPYWTREQRAGCGWDACALVDGRGELVFGTQAYKAAAIDVLDPAYRAVVDRKEAPQEIVALMSEMSDFLR